MTGLRKIPGAFYYDHVDRELPAPPVLKRAGAYVWVDPTDPRLEDLIQDAEFYAGEDGPEKNWYTRAAKSLLRALEGVA